jgi:hypothetical protein
MIEKGKCKLSGKYVCDNGHFINLGYIVEYNKKVMFAVEHKNDLTQDISDTIFVDLN